MVCWTDPWDLFSWVAISLQCFGKKLWLAKLDTPRLDYYFCKHNICRLQKENIASCFYHRIRITKQCINFCRTNNFKVIFTVLLRGINSIYQFVMQDCWTTITDKLSESNVLYSILYWDEQFILTQYFKTCPSCLSAKVVVCKGTYQGEALGLGGWRSSVQQVFVVKWVVGIAVTEI